MKDEKSADSEKHVGKKHKEASSVNHDTWDDFADWEEVIEASSGFFRGVAAATRKVALVTKKVVIAKAPAMKQTARQLGEQRALAFASEGAVAGDKLLPRVIYYGAWGLSGAAICADIYVRQEKAPPEKQNATIAYWTLFHVPASLVVPALIIHQIVHAVDHAVQNPKGYLKQVNLTPRMKAVAPVGAALISIIPVVPMVDYAAEAIMEPTLGKYLELDFDHDHGHGDKEKKKTKKND